MIPSTPTIPTIPGILNSKSPLPVDIFIDWEGSSISPFTLVGQDYSATPTPTENRVCGLFVNFTYRSTEFTLGVTDTIVRVIMRIAPVGTPTGTMTLRVHTDNGSDIPTTTILSTSTPVNCSTLSGPDLTYQDVVFTGLSAALTSGVKYHFSVQMSVIDASNYIRVGSGGSYTIPFGSAFNTFPTTGFTNEGNLEIYWQAYNGTPSNTYPNVTVPFLQNSTRGSTLWDIFPSDPMPFGTIGTWAKSPFPRDISIGGVLYNPTGSQCLQLVQEKLEYVEFLINGSSGSNNVSAFVEWQCGYAPGDFTFYDIFVLRSSLDYSVLSQEGGGGTDCSTKVHTQAGTSSGSILVQGGKPYGVNVEFHNGGNGVLRIFDLLTQVKIGSDISLNIPNPGPCTSIRIGGSGHPASGGPSPSPLIGRVLVDWTNAASPLVPW